MQGAQCAGEYIPPISISKEKLLEKPMQGTSTTIMHITTTMTKSTTLTKKYFICMPSSEKTGCTTFQHVDQLNVENG